MWKRWERLLKSNWILFNKGFWPKLYPLSKHLIEGDEWMKEIWLFVQPLFLFFVAVIFVDCLPLCFCCYCYYYFYFYYYYYYYYFVFVTDCFQTCPCRCCSFFVAFFCLFRFFVDSFKFSRCKWYVRKPSVRVAKCIRIKQRNHWKQTTSELTILHSMQKVLKAKQLLSNQNFHKVYNSLQ